MNQRFLLSRVFIDPPKPAIDRVLATTFFGDAPDRPAAVASLATRRTVIAAAAGLSGSTAPHSSHV